MPAPENTRYTEKLPLKNLPDIELGNRNAEDRSSAGELGAMLGQWLLAWTKDGFWGEPHTYAMRSISAEQLLRQVKSTKFPTDKVGENTRRVNTKWTLAL